MAISDQILGVDTSKRKSGSATQRGGIGSSTYADYGTPGGPRANPGEGGGMPMGQPEYKDPAVAAAQQLDYERRQAMKRMNAFRNMGFGGGGLLGAGGGGSMSGVAKQSLLGA